MTANKELPMDTISWEKRQTLARLSALTFAPWLPASAFATSIHALPRQALVIGNSAYSDAPLGNPANDANAIGGELRKLGFLVDVQINMRRESMTNTIERFAAGLAKNKAIGLFYFAGHGLQLDWRNFLVPVDAKLDRASDVPAQAVDITRLIEGLGKAGNPLNIVILDACRDNPFGSEHKTGKGLSQMDAPIGTLLAYATAPGNVASDGSGKNGLYTEQLLKEIGTPEAKIEDVFKRVRLAVRKASQGQQIPWESTSLEEDFYFIPPKNLKKASEEELARLFAAELSLWDEVQRKGDARALEGYLQKYPGGKFAELAQVMLDSLLAKEEKKRVRIANSSHNPYTKGSADIGRFVVGDEFRYRVLDHLTQLETSTFTHTVTAIDGDQVIFNGGQVITNLLGSPRLNAQGIRYGDSQMYAADYSLGKTWETRFSVQYADGTTDTIERDFRVVAREKISVPAGTFNAFKVETSGWIMQKGIKLAATYWIAPGEVPRYLLFEQSNRNRLGKLVNTDRHELLSFTPGKRG